MQILVEKLTSVELARLACQFTTHRHESSTISLHDLYACEHSPIRTQIFLVHMIEIPNFVSVHFVRHRIGVEHFVQTHREDRGANFVADRNTPVNHLMLLNAQALIQLARKRLCFKASAKTHETMNLIHVEICSLDPDLASFMNPECVYRSGVCYERKTCGFIPGTIHYKEHFNYERRRKN